MRMRAWRLGAGLLCCAVAGCAAGLPAPLGGDALRSLPSLTSPARPLGEVPGGAGHTSQLLTYQHAGLHQFALLVLPQRAPPAGGWPLVLTARGFHPNPPRYGFTQDGRNWRPGDYYRAVPEAFAAEGFAMLIPDYRGHNQSEGLEFTRRPRPALYYAEDLVALTASLRVLARQFPLHLEQQFLWGHSMGADVAVRAWPALPMVRAVSLWSVVDALQGGETPQQAFGLVRAPVQIQHAERDKTTPFSGSLKLESALRLMAKPVTLHAEPGDEHLFTGAALRAAVARDALFFRRAAQAPQGDSPMSVPTR